MEIPVIIGVGDVRNRSLAIADAKEPAQLILEAIHLAILDSKAEFPGEMQAAIDGIDVVKTWTWPYPDLPGLLASKLGVEGTLRHKLYSDHGGNQPAKLCDEAARRVSRGECKIAVVCGGEALASLSACAAVKQLPPPGWTKPSTNVVSVPTPTGRDLGTNLGAIHDIGSPIHVYPLYENAFRAHRQQSIEASHEESAQLYADFAEVAEKMPYAWNYGSKVGKDDIKTVGKKNRMICYPYPLLMNAFNMVNLASAVLMTSTSMAEKLGVPRERWIYPLGGAGTKDAEDFWKRPNYYTSPSISRSLDACLSVCNTTQEDIDLYDFYSCFPIVPKLACQHLGLPTTKGEKPITLLGGLTSFGGAGNNYSMHALTEMTRQLRDGKGKKGLVLANGGVLSYQHAIVLSTTPRVDGAYPEKNPLPAEVTDLPIPEVITEAEGEAVVETYTVEFKRDGSTLRGYIVGRLKENAKRFLANAADEHTLARMASGKEEIVGLEGFVKRDIQKKGRCLFTLQSTEVRARI